MKIGRATDGEFKAAFGSSYPRNEAVFTLSDQKRPGEASGEEIRKDDDGERHYLLVGRGLSPEAMVDTVMAWLEEHGLAEADEPPGAL
jgi:hypothetical protein